MEKSTTERVLDALDGHYLFTTRDLPKREDRIMLRLRDDGKRKIIIPAFQYEPTLEGVQIRPVVATVNQLLGAKDCPWEVAFWWLLEHPRLRGRAPSALLGTEGEDALLKVAKDGLKS